MKLMKRLNSKKAIFTAFVIAASVSMMTSAAWADGTANAAVTGAFTSLKDDVLATLGVVAALGVGVMAVFLAWKYGRKIFNQVAK